MTKPALLPSADDASFLVGAALPAMGRSASGRRWVIRGFDAEKAAAISAAAGCDPAIARILAGRGVEPATAASYLNPSLKEFLPDPSTLIDMDKAAARIAQAIMTGERCGVFGDYDVDGTSAAAILKSFFDDLGAPLDVYLPDRILEGYGPTIEAFRALKAGGANMIMTVDCGAAAHEAINAAAADGLDIIVLDHHQMDGPPPSGAFATINPNRPDDRSGLTTLSAAGVAFMAVIAANRALRSAGWYQDRKEPDPRRYLDLVALGLVCDVMPMTGLARVLTAQGLKMLGQANDGLAALGARAGVKYPATAYDLGFLLGPRINAAGRIGHARLAFELLTTRDAKRRAELADHLHVMNDARRRIEQDVQDAAIAAIEQNGLDRHPVITVAGEGWHPGVIGIVAGRIRELYDRPAVVIAIDGETAKGSARSMEGVDIGSAFRRARNEGLLIAGGGHAMAAGLTIAADAIAPFAAFLDDQCRADVERALMERVRLIDAVVAPSAVSAAFADAIAAAGPYGPGNPEPLFVIGPVRARTRRIVGERHVAAELATPTGEPVRAIAFRAAGEPIGEMLAADRFFFAAGRIKADSWRGGDAGQFQLVDLADAPAR